MTENLINTNTIQVLIGSGSNARTEYFEWDYIFPGLNVDDVPDDEILRGVENFMNVRANETNGEQVHLTNPVDRTIYTVTKAHVGRNTDAFEVTETPPFVNILIGPKPEFG